MLFSVQCGSDDKAMDKLYLSCMVSVLEIQM